jgi:Family of unknown function (DUF6152)
MTAIRWVPMATQRSSSNLLKRGWKLLARRVRGGAHSVTLGFALTLPVLALAHHSVSGQFDESKSMEITGVVTRVDWINPHTYLYVDAKNAKGAVVAYKLECLPVAMMRKAGVAKQQLVGDGRPVHIKAYPARNGDATLGFLVHMKTADGRELQFTRVPEATKP